MKIKISYIGVCILFLWSCKTAQIEPTPAMPEVPKYVRVSHPVGLDLGDLRAIFVGKEAPQLEALKTCDADFIKLRELTQSKEEQEAGVRELVKTEPVKYHWCFYGKILLLENQIKDTAYLDEKQKNVLDVFVFLTPISKAFLKEYKDSRYLRWAISRYRRLSEFVFYRKVELNSTMSTDLAIVPPLGSNDPYGFYRESSAETNGVLEKYGLGKMSENNAKENSSSAPVTSVEGTADVSASESVGRQPARK